MAEDFDPTPYVRPPILDVASGVALGVALISAMPKPAPENVHKAATKVRKDTVALQLAWAKSDSAAPPLDRRKSDMRIDNAWGILLDRLEAYSLLPVADYPKATRARELLDTISPKDREWLKLIYQAEWAESTKRLERIEDEGLVKDIKEIAGPEFPAIGSMTRPGMSRYLSPHYGYNGRNFAILAVRRLLYVRAQHQTALALEVSRDNHLDAHPKNILNFVKPPETRAADFNLRGSAPL